MVVWRLGCGLSLPWGYWLSEAVSGWLRAVLSVGALVDRLLHRTGPVIVLFRNGLRRRRVRRIILSTMQKGGLA